MIILFTPLEVNPKKADKKKPLTTAAKGFYLKVILCFTFAII